MEYIFARRLRTTRRPYILLVFAGEDKRSSFQPWYMYPRPDHCQHDEIRGGVTDNVASAMLQKVRYAGGNRRENTDNTSSGLTISMQTVDKSPIPMCVSAISTPLPVRALYTTTYTNGRVDSFYEQIINDQSTVSNMTTMTQGTAVADPLYVAWEAKDLSLFPVAYATSLAQKIGVDFTPTATPASGATAGGATQTSRPSKDNNSQDSGLSSGAKIGIGVGVGVGAALLAALIAMCFIIRRLRKRNQPALSYPDETTPAMDGHGAGLAKNKWYQRSRPNEEIEMNTGPNELDSMPVNYIPTAPVELEGSHIRERY
jgi:hypothetical protein